MLSKKNKIILILFIILFFIHFSLFCQEADDLADTDPENSSDQVDTAEINEDPEEDNPAGSFPEMEIPDPPSEPRYTDEEFSNLSDEEKINVYFNFPQLLPDNFNPDPYMHIFHPEPGNTE